MFIVTGGPNIKKLRRKCAPECTVNTGDKDSKLIKVSGRGQALSKAVEKVKAAIADVEQKVAAQKPAHVGPIKAHQSLGGRSYLLSHAQ